jgi:hypothetical protein
MKQMRRSCPRLAVRHLADWRFVRAGEKAWTGFCALRLVSSGWQEKRGRGMVFSAAQLNDPSPDLAFDPPFGYPR